jgi:hypothetical protein
MIVKIIPEGTEQIQEVTHHNVKQFFICGAKKDEHGTPIDFHDWAGGYKFLISQLSYFLDTIKTERDEKQLIEKLEEILSTKVVDNVTRMPSPPSSGCKVPNGVQMPPAGTKIKAKKPPVMAGGVPKPDTPIIKTVQAESQNLQLVELKTADEEQPKTVENAVIELQEQVRQDNIEGKPTFIDT